MGGEEDDDGVRLLSTCFSHGACGGWELELCW